MKGRFILACAMVATVAGFVATQTAEAQWRTKYVNRDGLFHVEKYRTGNGITPAFAGVLNTLITTAPDIIDSATGRDLDAETTRARAIDESWKTHYAEQQAAANDLLVRTARLAGINVSDASPSPPTPPTPFQPLTNDRGTPTNEAESGPNPWRN